MQLDAGTGRTTVKNMRPQERASRPERTAILPLRKSVLFPMSVVPINVGRPRSVRLVEELVGRDSALVGVVTQRAAETIEPTFEDLYRVGTLARVVKVIRLGSANYSVVLNGLVRFRLGEPRGLEPFMRADIERVPETTALGEPLRALGARLRDRTRQVLGLMPNLPKETAGISTTFGSRARSPISSRRIFPRSTRASLFASRSSRRSTSRRA